MFASFLCKFKKSQIHGDREIRGSQELEGGDSLKGGGVPSMNDADVLAFG